MGNRPQLDLKSATVLVVEDTAIAREPLVKLLGYEGYRAIGVTNGQEALELLRAGPRPAIILLDLVMPVMDGWEFLRQRERDPSLASIPVVVVSAGDPGLARATALGAVAFLQKPVDPGNLASEVRRRTGQGEQMP